MAIFFALLVTVVAVHKWRLIVVSFILKGTNFKYRGIEKNGQSVIQTYQFLRRPAPGTNYWELTEGFATSKNLRTLIQESSKN